MQRGFFDAFRNINRGAIQIHQNQMENSSNWNNPFHRLKDYFNANPSHVDPLHQPNFQLPPLQLNAMQAAVNMNPLQHQNNPGNVSSQPFGLNFPNQEAIINHRQIIQEEHVSFEIPQYRSTESRVVPQHFVESLVQQVNLQDLPQTVHVQDNSHELQLGQKIFNYFSSLKDRLIPKNEKQDHQIEGEIVDTGLKLHEHQNLLVSQVQQYDPERRLRETISRQIAIEQSIVIQNN